MTTASDQRVKSAKRIATAIGQMLRFSRDHETSDVQFVFAGFDAYKVALELGPEASGRVYVIPSFRVTENRVELERIWVVDGMSLPGRCLISSCDLVREQGIIGLLTRGDGETYFYIIDRARAIILYDTRCRWDANKMIKAGKRALAKRLGGTRPIAA